MITEREIESFLARQEMLERRQKGGLTNIRAEGDMVGLDYRGGCFMLSPAKARELAAELRRVADEVEREAGRKNLRDIDSAAKDLMDIAGASMNGLTVRDHTQINEMLKAVVAFRDYVHNETCMYDD